MSSPIALYQKKYNFKLARNIALVPTNMLIDADAKNWGSVVGKVIGLRAGRQRSCPCFPQK
jgi:hypothetical protein